LLCCGLYPTHTHHGIAQPVERDAPPSGAEWVHEIKHDGYRMIVWRDGDSVRLHSRNRTAGGNACSPELTRMTSYGSHRYI
jgi:ATP-dependent DNA ligase